MSRKPYDRDVWAPPSPKPSTRGRDGQQEDPLPPPPPASKFMQHFHNRMVVVGKDGANAQLPSAAAGPTAVAPKRTTSGASSASAAAATVRGKKPGPKGGILSPEELRAGRVPKSAPLQRHVVEPSNEIADDDAGTGPQPQLVSGAAELVSRSAPPQLNVLSLQLQQRPALAKRPSSGQRLTPIQQAPQCSSPSLLGDGDGGVAARALHDGTPARGSPFQLPAHPKPAFRPTGVFARPRRAHSPASSASSASCEVIEVAGKATPASGRRRSAGSLRSGPSPVLRQTPSPSSSSGVVVVERLECLVEPRAKMPGWRRKYEPPEEQQQQQQPAPRDINAKHGGGRVAHPAGRTSAAAAATQKKSASPAGRKGKRAAGPNPEEHQDGPVGRKPVEYTPATVDDYKALMQKYAAHKPARSLGPADTDEQRRARERKARELSYGRAVERAAARERQSSTPKTGEGDTDAGAEDGEALAVVASATPASPVTPRSQQQQQQGRRSPPKITQPPSKQLLQARERRLRAMSYGRAVEQQQQQEEKLRLAGGGGGAGGFPSDDDDERDEFHAKERELARAAGGGGGARAAKRPETYADVVAAERRRRLADLEAQHERNKASVDAIRRQFAARA